MDGSPRVVVITGPTAAGKTDLALAVAAHLPAEILSADSRQVYRYMDIGTGKPGVDQRAAVSHHMLDVAYPDTTFSVAAYRQMAEAILVDIHSRGHIALVVGGSFHYLQALLDRFDVPPRNPRLRAWLQRRDQRDPGGLDRWLRALDPRSAQTIHGSNRRRVLRALEVVLTTGSPFSQRGRQRQEPMPALWVGLRWNRSALHRRVRERIAGMMEAGWLREVRMLLAMGYSPELPSMTATGYDALAGVVRGEESLDAAAERIGHSTHAFIRHQQAWLRREARIHWVEADEPKLAARFMALYDRFQVPSLKVQSLTLTLGL